MVARIPLSLRAALAALIVVPSLMLAQGPASAPPPPARGPLTFDTATGQRILVTQVAGGLVHPYSLAFPDSHTILVAERSGRLRIIRDGRWRRSPRGKRRRRRPASPPSNNPPDALHFIELHPGFAQNHLVYLSTRNTGRAGTPSRWAAAR